MLAAVGGAGTVSACIPTSRRGRQHTCRHDAASVVEGGRSGVEAVTRLAIASRAKTWANKLPHTPALPPHIP